MDTKEKINDKELYLPEDQDLLKELDSIGPLSTGQALEEQKKRIQVIQIKASLRNRKSFDKFDKETSTYTIILIVFAMVQIIVALGQFIFAASSGTNHWLSLLVVIAIVGMIIFILKKFDKLLKNK